MDLDMLLEEARETEPVDDGFTDRLMAAVRSDATAAWRRRRFFTRPMALAAAAMLVTGGALAARSIVTPDAPELTGPAGQAELTTGPSRTQITAPPPAPASMDAAEDGEAADDPGPRVVRTHEDYEWGYTSRHTAYVLHHTTGLHLETKTHTNSFEVGRPHEVTLTLSNTGDESLAIAARQRCALAVAAYDASERDERSPVIEPTRDRSAPMTRCAGEAPESTPERFVLAPGESRTVDTRLVFERAGDWAVVGMCRCTVSQVQDEPEETDDGDGTLRLPDLMLGLPMETVPEVPSRLTSPERGDRGRFVTPPIHIEVR